MQRADMLGVRMSIAFVIVARFAIVRIVSRASRLYAFPQSRRKIKCLEIIRQTTAHIMELPRSGALSKPTRVRERSEERTGIVTDLLVSSGRIVDGARYWRACKRTQREDAEKHTDAQADSLCLAHAEEGSGQH